MPFQPFPQTLQTDTGQLTLHLGPEPSALPTVSILTPTGPGRHIFADLMSRNWQAIDYPPELLEWVIVDEGNSAPTLGTPGDPRIRRVRIQKPQNSSSDYPNSGGLPIGKKRNFLGRLARHQILVHMDDDDYYPPESVSARVRALLAYDDIGCVGCDRAMCYDLLRDQTFEASDPDTDGHPRTISESTMAYPKEFLRRQGFCDTDRQAECLSFLANRHHEVRTLPSVFVVTQLTHGHNTITRWALRDTHHTAQWPPRLPARDRLLLEDLRAKAIAMLPGWPLAIATVGRWAHQPPTRSELRALPPEVLGNPMVLGYLRGLPGRPLGPKSLAWWAGGGRHLQPSKPWTGATEGLGGSESALRDVAEGLAANGWDVSVFVPIREPLRHRGVRWRPLWEWRPLDHWEWLAVWRDPSALADVALWPGTKVLLDLHDALPAEWVRPWAPKAAWVLTRSHFHKDLIGNPPNAIVVPNGISVPTAVPTAVAPVRKPIILATSSPDRCLGALVRALPLVRKEIPDAEVWWAYGWREGLAEGGLEADPRPKVREWVSALREACARTEGLRDLGRLTESEVAKAYGEAKVFGYGTLFPEIDCISMTKALAAGCVPVVTHVAALGEKLDLVGIPGRPMSVAPEGTLDYSLPEGEEFQRWVRELCEALRGPDGPERVLPGYSAGEVLRKWLGLIKT